MIHIENILGLLEDTDGIRRKFIYFTFLGILGIFWIDYEIMGNTSKGNREKRKKLQHLVDIFASDTCLFSTPSLSILNLLLVDLLKGWVGLFQWPFGPWGEPDSAMITKACLCTRTDHDFWNRDLDVGFRLASRFGLEHDAEKLLTHSSCLWRVKLMWKSAINILNNELIQIVKSQVCEHDPMYCVPPNLDVLKSVVTILPVP